MIKTYATEIERGKKYFYRPGVYVILPFENQVLLTFQADPHNEFQLPGGGVDVGEQPITALYREVIEETGWGVVPPTAIGGLFRDRLGALAQRLDRQATRSWLVLQGRAVDLHAFSEPVP